MDMWKFWVENFSLAIPLAKLSLSSEDTGSSQRSSNARNASIGPSAPMPMLLVDLAHTPRFGHD